MPLLRLVLLSIDFHRSSRSREPGETPAIGGRSRSCLDCLGRSRRSHRYRHPRFAQAADIPPRRAARCERHCADYPVRVPMQIRRRGFEMRLVIQGSRAPAPLADPALMKAIARGRQWADDLLSGREPSVAKSPSAKGSRALRQATDAVGVPGTEDCRSHRGRQQPPELTAKALTERIELPLLWTAQEEAVGI